MQHLDEGRLQAWLDRPRSGLEPDELDAIEQHLAVCESCATRVKALKASTERAMSLLGTRARGGRPPFAAVQARAEKGEASVGPASGDSDGPSVSVRRRRWRSTRWAASVAVALGAGWLANDLVRRPGGGGGAVTADEAVAVDSSARQASGLGTAEMAGSPTEEGAPAPAAQPAAPGLAPPPAGIEIPAPIVAEAERAEGVSNTLSDLASADRTADVVASSPVFVRGRVVDAASGRPLESAQVFVPSLQKGALTGADGSFALLLDDSVAAGGEELTMQVQLIGFADASRPLVIPRADTVLEDLRLETTALMLQELVVTGLPAPEPETRRSAAAARVVRADGPEGWAPTTRVDVEAAAGFSPVSIPELEVVSIEMRSMGDRVLLRVVQELEEGGQLTLIQAPWPVPLAPDPTGRSVASTQVGDVWVTGLAPISEAALQDLLQRLR